MVLLKPVTGDNLDEVLALKVHESQKRYVSTAAESLAQAYVYSKTAFPFAVYHGKDIVVIPLVQCLVERGRRPRVHQVYMPVADLYAVLQDLYKGGLIGRYSLIYDIDDRIFRILLKDLP